MIESILIAYFLQQFIPKSAPVDLESTAVRGSQLIVEVQQSSIHTIAQGTQRVPVLTLQLSASCDAPVTVDSLVVYRRGLGESTDIDAVYAMSDGQRLQRAVQPSRMGVTHLRLRNFTIEPCGKRTIQILADFSPNASVAGEHWFTIESATDVVANNTNVVLHSSRQPSKKFTGAGPTVGTISVEYPRLLQTLRYGENRTVARLRLSADGTSDHLIHFITLTNEGSARDTDLQNIYLRAGRSRTVSAVLDSLSGDTARLELQPPLILEQNQSRILEVRADIRASRSRTLRFLVEQPSDIQSEVIRRKSVGK
ncbi:hypothetical protein COU78_05370 [Candidatus Peregrinibacteria bacterium CG10_big_fil_rev_8_21_14_0_10_49_24]|nr:MAG: hypothetical protein COV83_01740 [Candidatus Peregrinibacteria bacterium CG11_big_fil_rev_8_21_14_0_20_49_14]PIR50774.1 MAG: hypothetical protein COU78_05370 [Candidatus Peregrinibacteria bacterium CG10_big_fil_rev_8_21_14_0_10_49_24]PJA68181.1 MAG: hypothetical protein CO157_00440 [Candidatus Peregrinibacteria bacterium CG_4_9_14_3_um_filter_49_12]